MWLFDAINLKSDLDSKRNLLFIIISHSLLVFLIYLQYSRYSTSCNTFSLNLRIVIYQILNHTKASANFQPKLDIKFTGTFTVQKQLLNKQSVLHITLFPYRLMQEPKALAPLTINLQIMHQNFHHYTFYINFLSRKLLKY